MKLAGIPQGTIDWSQIAATTHPGTTGQAVARSRQLGAVQIRLVEYGAGYLADHWCPKGHILFVVAGELVIEHDGGARYLLGPNMTWHVSDDTGPPHRVRCERGASAFIMD